MYASSRFPYGPSILLALFVVIITVIGNGIMVAFGYANIARIIGTVFIVFFTTMIILICQYLRDKLSGKQNKEKK